METTNIYTLTDPRTNEVRYVGKANNVKQRYKAHLNRARKHQTYKKNWLEQLRREGLKPIIDVIDVVPMGDWQYWETYWISQMKQWGFNLVNHTNGGDGCSFANQTSFKKGQGGKKVVAYNSDYEKVYEFATAEDATRELKTHRSSIPRCAGGKSKTIKGYAWFYECDVIGVGKSDLVVMIGDRFIKNLSGSFTSFKGGENGNKAKEVLMCELDWTIIREFESAKAAAEFIGVKSRVVRYACTKGKNNKYNDNKFKYK